MQNLYLHSTVQMYFVVNMYSAYYIVAYMYTGH